MPKTITTTDLADALGTTPKITRKFLRATIARDEHPGKGGTWVIEARSVRSLKSQFTKWVKAQDDARTAREAKKATNETNAPETDITPDEDIDDISLDALEGPTDADLDAIDA